MGGLGGRWVILVGLGALLGCADDLSEVTPPATSSEGSTGSSSGGAASSSSSGSSGRPEDTSSSGQVDTTLGVSATDTGTTREDETTAAPGTTTSGGSTEDGSSTGPEPLDHPTAQPDGACMLRQQASVLVAEVLANDSDPQGSPV